MKPLFIIPARGGSKGIPRKNIRLLGGKPLIAHSINVALEVASRKGIPATNILVSTDDAEIAEIAANAGAPTPYRRPAHLATDTAGSREVILDAMDRASENGVEFDCVVLLQPTSPFRTADDVEATMQLYAEKNPDMAVTVKRASSNPYYNSFETDTDGFLHISKGDGLYTRRQDAPEVWELNGAVYVINPDSIRQMPLGKFPRRIGYEMPAERSIDLDSPIDWAIAELLLQQGLVKLN